MISWCTILGGLCSKKTFYWLLQGKEKLQNILWNPHLLWQILVPRFSQRDDENRIGSYPRNRPKKHSSTYIPSCFMPILKLQTQAVKSLLNPFYTNPMFPKQRSHAFSMSVEEESSCSDTSARVTRPVTLPSSPPTWRPGHGISWKKTWKSDMLKNHQWNGDWNGKDWEKIDMLFKYYIYIIIYSEIGKDMVVLTNLSSDQEGNRHLEPSPSSSLVHTMMG